LDYILGTLSTLIIWQMVQSHSIVQNALIVSGLISFIYILYYAITKLDKIARERLLALTILIVFTIVFWALFEQAYTSMNLFADRALDTRFLGVDWKPEPVFKFECFIHYFLSTSFRLDLG
jgi:proton-dependent oligopeptide transporter, POT family